MNLNSIAVKKVLPFIALRPGERFTLSDLMRESGQDSQAVSRVLQQFRRDDFIVAGERRTYGVNTGHPMYPEMKAIALRLLDIPGSIDAAGAQAGLVVAYGSLLRPTFGRESDIDLLIVSDQEAAVRRAVGAVEQRIGKRLSVKALGQTAFSRQLRHGDPFIREVFERPHVILSGSIERYGGLA